MQRMSGGIKWPGAESWKVSGLIPRIQLFERNNCSIWNTFSNGLIIWTRFDGKQIKFLYAFISLCILLSYIFLCEPTRTSSMFQPSVWRTTPASIIYDAHSTSPLFVTQINNSNESSACKKCLISYSFAGFLTNKFLEPRTWCSSSLLLSTEIFASAQSLSEVFSDKFHGTMDSNSRWKTRLNICVVE